MRRKRAGHPCRHTRPAAALSCSKRKPLVTSLVTAHLSTALPCASLSSFSNVDIRPAGWQHAVHTPMLAAPACVQIHIRIVDKHSSQALFPAVLRPPKFPPFLCRLVISPPAGMSSRSLCAFSSHFQH